MSFAGLWRCCRHDVAINASRRSLDYRGAAGAPRDAVRRLREHNARFVGWLPFIHVGLWTVWYHGWCGVSLYISYCLCLFVCMYIVKHNRNCATRHRTLRLVHSRERGSLSNSTRNRRGCTAGRRDGGVAGHRPAHVARRR
jgi:hypothetical protein